MGLHPRPSLRLPLDTRRMARALRQMPMLRPVGVRPPVPWAPKNQPSFRMMCDGRLGRRFLPAQHLRPLQAKAQRATRILPPCATMSPRAPMGLGAATAARAPPYARGPPWPLVGRPAFPMMKAGGLSARPQNPVMLTWSFERGGSVPCAKKGFETSQAATAGKQCELRAAGSEAGQARTCGSCAKHLEIWPSTALTAVGLLRAEADHRQSLWAGRSSEKANKCLSRCGSVSLACWAPEQQEFAVAFTIYQRSERHFLRAMLGQWLWSVCQTLQPHPPSVACQRFHSFPSC